MNEQLSEPELGSTWQVNGEFIDAIIARQDYLYALAFGLTRDPSKSTDIVQETYDRALRFHHKFKEGTSLAAWLNTILRNVLYSFYRKSQREVPLEDESLAAIIDRQSPNYEDILIRKIDVSKTVQQVGRTKQRMLDTLLLLEVNGMSIEETAVFTDSPVGTVKSRSFRAKKYLRSELEDYEPIKH